MASAHWPSSTFNRIAPFAPSATSGGAPPGWAVAKVTARMSAARRWRRAATSTAEATAGRAAITVFSRLAFRLWIVSPPIEVESWPVGVTHSFSGARRGGVVKGRVSGASFSQRLKKATMSEAIGCKAPWPPGPWMKLSRSSAPYRA